MKQPLQKSIMMRAQKKLKEISELFVDFSKSAAAKLEDENKSLQAQVSLLQKKNSDLQDQISKANDSASFYRNANDTLKKDLDCVRKEYDKRKILDGILMNVFQCLYGVKVREELGTNASSIIRRAEESLEAEGYSVITDCENQPGCFTYAVGNGNTEKVLVKSAIIKGDVIIAYGTVIIPEESKFDHSQEENEEAQMQDNSNNMNSTKKLYE